MLTNKTKSDLAKDVSELCTMQITPGNAAIVIDALMKALSTAFMNGEEVTLRGFGTFRVVKYKPRPGRDIKAGKQIVVPARTTVKFKPGKKLREGMNGSFKGVKKLRS